MFLCHSPGYELSQEMGKKESQTRNVVHDRSGGGSGSISTDSPRPVPVPRPVPRRCFLCNSPAHLALACPQKSSGGGFTPKPTPRPQVNLCKTKQKADTVKYQSKQAIDSARDNSRDDSLGGSTFTPGELCQFAA